MTDQKAEKLARLVERMGIDFQLRRGRFWAERYLAMLGALERIRNGAISRDDLERIGIKLGVIADEAEAALAEADKLWPPREG